MATGGSTLRFEEADALASLEERVLRAVDLVNQLRKENEAMKQRFDTATADRETAESQINELKAENARLSAELEELRSERTEVRSRIEKLLGQMDLLAS
jgi:chromosome segregation ATPase